MGNSEQPTREHTGAAGGRETPPSQTALKKTPSLPARWSGTICARPPNDPLEQTSRSTNPIGNRRAKSGAEQKNLITFYVFRTKPSGRRSTREVCATSATGFRSIIAWWPEDGKASRSSSSRNWPPPPRRAREEYLLLRNWKSSARRRASPCPGGG